MRITSRLLKLERVLAPPAPPESCWACGQFDAATGLPVFLGGVRIEQGDGILACFCKRCGRSFHGQFETASAGRTLVRNMVAAELGV